jgi:hypothetical protein
MAPVASLESRIDALYQLPLAGFTGARTALAKSLAGPEALRVRRLAKPTLVPWAINQLYWNARPVYDRVMQSGNRLRAAQIAQLKGRPADIRDATEAHREALARAVHKSGELAAAVGSRPSGEALARTLEALSLSGTPLEHPGRLTEILQPAGFEALSGITPAARQAPDSVPRAPRTKEMASPKGAHEEEKRAREERLRERERAEARRKADAAVKAAESVLKRAQAAEQRARSGAEEAAQDVENAKRQLMSARAHLERLSMS